MTERRAVAAVIALLAAIAVVSGAGSLVWAVNREYADNQRNWGYLLGWLGLASGAALGLVALIVLAWEGPSTATEHAVPESAETSIDEAQLDRLWQANRTDPSA